MATSTAVTADREAMSNASSDRLTLLAHLHMQRVFTAERIEYRDPAADVPGRQVDIPKLKRGGVNYICPTDRVRGDVGGSATCAAHVRDPHEHDAMSNVFERGAGVPFAVPPAFALVNGELAARHTSNCPSRLCRR